MEEVCGIYGEQVYICPPLYCFHQLHHPLTFSDFIIYISITSHMEDYVILRDCIPVDFPGINTYSEKLHTYKKKIAPKA